MYIEWAPKRSLNGGKYTYMHIWREGKVPRTIISSFGILNTLITFSQSTFGLCVKRSLHPLTTQFGLYLRTLRLQNDSQIIGPCTE